MHGYVQVLGEDQTNIFVNLSAADLQTSRKLLMVTILGTDMASHFGQVTKAQVLHCYCDQ